VACSSAVKKAEIFYGENRGDVHHFARSVVDAGADIVLGHGPHVTRAVEVYKNKFTPHRQHIKNLFVLFLDLILEED